MHRGTEHESTDVLYFFNRTLLMICFARSLWFFASHDPINCWLTTTTLEKDPTLSALFSQVISLICVRPHSCQHVNTSFPCHLHLVCSCQLCAIHMVLFCSYHLQCTDWIYLRLPMSGIMCPSTPHATLQPAKHTLPIPTKWTLRFPYPISATQPTS